MHDKTIVHTRPLSVSRVVLGKARFAVAEAALGASGVGVITRRRPKQDSAPQRSRRRPPLGAADCPVGPTAGGRIRHGGFSCDDVISHRCRIRVARR